MSTTGDNSSSNSSNNNQKLIIFGLLGCVVVCVLLVICTAISIVFISYVSDPIEEPVPLTLPYEEYPPLNNQFENYIGDNIEVGNLIVSVQSAEVESLPNLYDNTGLENDYVAVSVTLTNNSDSDEYISPYSWSLYNSDIVYYPSIDQIYLPDNLPSNAILPGDTISGNIYFDLPVDYPNEAFLEYYPLFAEAPILISL